MTKELFIRESENSKPWVFFYFMNGDVPRLLFGLNARQLFDFREKVRKKRGIISGHLIDK